VDDIPLLFGQMKKMDLKHLIDCHFPAHGNHQGLSPGQLVEIWLCYILSHGDHRLCHVQNWAERIPHTLNMLGDEPVPRPLDFSDDRLADTLKLLSNDESWRSFEEGLGRRLLRVYDLNTDHIRIDTTTSTGYWKVTEEGIFQLGHSKDHRPDLPQIKAVFSTLDPLGLPIATDVVAGNRADDPLYIPAIKRVRSTLKKKGLLYIGDCKMASLETRAFIAAGKDMYLCPLSEVIMPEKELERLLEPVWTGTQSLTPVIRPDENGKENLVAEGFEVSIPMSATVDGKKITWQERRLVVRSEQFAETGKKALQARIAKAREEIEALNQRGRGKKRFDDMKSLVTATNGIIKKRKATGIIEVTFQENTIERAVRKYGENPAGIKTSKEFRVHTVINESALTRALQKPGWRVYATNCTIERLPLEKAVLAYREQYIIERSFGRLKGKALSIRPMYLERDDHATGLLRLLTIGLRVLVLIEFAARQSLARENSSISGVYAGNPKRSTSRPTAELILEAFENIDIELIKGPNKTLCILSPLSSVQQRILGLLGISPEAYTKLTGVFYDSS
jgi:transposase